jgi:nucleoside-diphosphate-sugar epimerase
MILVTGSSGFIGSHLVEKIPDSFGLDKLDRGQKERFVCIDLLDREKLFWFMKDMQFETVLHNAAVAGVPQSFFDPMKTYLNNVNATVNLIDACLKTGVKKLVLASTSSVEGTSPYGHSKKVCEEILKRSGLKFTILRYFNVFGPRQRPNVLEAMRRQLEDNRAVTIFGDGSTARDFTYVDNVVLANKKVISAYAGETLEVGTGSSFSLHHLYYILRDRINKDHDKVSFLPKRIGDLDFSRAKTFLKRDEIVTLKQGIDLWLSGTTRAA